NIETTTRYFLGLLIGTNISVGSVINYALMAEDYATIKAKAQKEAKRLACFVKKMEGAPGKVQDGIKSAKSGAAKAKQVASDMKKDAKGTLKKEGKAAVGAVKDSLAKGKVPEMPGGMDMSCDSDDGDDFEMPEKYSDYINFAKGVDHALALYFSMMGD
ncbi:MAG: hypothetical protein MI747_08015, partial [Desulfobacterales bacterium]|nr:hypothetical protein [Desulfobacterales bacterium]